MINPEPPHGASESKNESKCPKSVGNAQEHPAGTRVIINNSSASLGVGREGRREPGLFPSEQEEI